MKKHIKNYRVILWSLVVAVIICGGYYVYSLDTVNKDRVPQNHFEHYHYELFRTNDYVFSCEALVATESPCDLKVSNIKGGPMKDLQISSWDPRTNFIVSPNKNNMLIVDEHNASIYDLTHPDNVPRQILSVSDDKALGTYSEVPTFEGKAKWIDDKNVEISVYESYTSSEDSLKIKPLEIRKIRI